jgi:hypothetical protein
MAELSLPYPAPHIVWPRAAGSWVGLLRAPGALDEARIHCQPQ